MAHRAVFATFLLLVGYVCTVPARSQVDSARMSAWVGMYPNDRVRGVMFLEDPEVEARVTDALGPGSITQMEKMSLVGPIVHRGDWLIAYGCQPDVCAEAKWWVAINLTSFEARACLGLPKLPTVRFEINGALTLDFIVDSGAADVSVPIDVFSTLLRTGTIQDSDIMGEQTYVLADGSQSKSITFTIRSLKVGDKIVNKVRGSVGSSGGILLLGQSFLERFKSWSVDNVNHELVLEPR